MCSLGGGVPLEEKGAVQATEHKAVLHQVVNLMVLVLERVGQFWVLRLLQSFDMGHVLLLQSQEAKGRLNSTSSCDSVS